MPKLPAVRDSKADLNELGLDGAKPAAIATPTHCGFCNAIEN